MPASVFKCQRLIKYIRECVKNRFEAICTHKEAQSKEGKSLVPLEKALDMKTFAFTTNGSIFFHYVLPGKIAHFLSPKYQGSRDES